MNFSYIEQLGIDPVTSEFPAGQKARGGETFERLKEEIDKQASFQDVATDWSRVIDLGATILEKESKDILVVSYLCVGVFKVHGLAGLNSGLACLENLCTNFWEGIFPPPGKKKARVAAITWLGEQTDKIAGHFTLGKDEQQAAEECLKKIDALSVLFREKFEESIGLTGLKRHLKQQLLTLEPTPEKKVPPEPVASEPVPADPPAADPPPASPPPPEPPIQKPDQTTATPPEPEPIPDQATVMSPVPDQAMASIQDAGRILKTAVETARKVASFRRQQHLLDPVAYELVRFSAWIEIEQLPLNENGITRIPGVEEPVVRTLENHVKSGNWQAVIELTESQIIETPFWLDLNFYCAEALSRMGDEAMGAKHVVTGKTRLLLKRFPDLLGFKFSNGMAFVAKKTAQWLEKGKKTPAVTTMPDLNQDQGRSGDALSEQLTRADGYIEKKQFQEAFLLVEKGLDSATRKKDRFRLKLKQAKICMEMGNPKVALPVLDNLASQIRRFGLEDWEPALCSRVFYLTWLALDTLYGNNTQISPEIEQRITKNFEKCCRLNPMLMLEAGT